MKHLPTFLLLLLAFNSTHSQWEVVHIGEQHDVIQALKFANDSVGWAMGNDFIFKTMDGGDNWETISSTEGYIRDFSIVSPDTLILVSFVENFPESIGSILKSTDGGLSWNIQYNGELVHADVQMTSSQIGYATSYDVLIKTIDGGETWQPIFNQLPSGAFDGGYNASHMFNDSVGLLSGSGFFNVVGGGFSFRQFIFRTTNAWNDWEEVELEGSPHFRDFYFMDDSIGYTTRGEILSTTDGGLSWSRIEHPFSIVADIAAKSLDEIIAIHSYELITDGSEPSFAITTTADGGATWEGDWVDGGATLNDIHFLNDSVGFVAGQHGLIMKTENCGGPLPDDYPYHLFSFTNEFEIEEVSLFPNPATHTIYFPNEAGKTWSFIIANVSGQRILAGSTQNNKINIDQLPSGNYFLLLEKDEVAKIGQFMK